MEGKLLLTLLLQKVQSPQHLKVYRWEEWEVAAYLEALGESLGTGKLFLVFVRLPPLWPISFLFLYLVMEEIDLMHQSWPQDNMKG